MSATKKKTVSGAPAGAFETKLRDECERIFARHFRRTWEESSSLVSIRRVIGRGVSVQTRKRAQTVKRLREIGLEAREQVERWRERNGAAGADGWSDEDGLIAMLAPVVDALESGGFFAQETHARKIDMPRTELVEALRRSFPERDVNRRAYAAASFLAGVAPPEPVDRENVPAFLRREGEAMWKVAGRRQKT